MKKKLFFLYIIIVMLSSMMATSSSVSAENVGGGQVTVQGKITFKEDTKPQLPNTKKITEEKKLGRLPKTGEIRNRWFWLSGGILLALSLVLLWLLRRNREEKL